MVLSNINPFTLTGFLGLSLPLIIVVIAVLPVGQLFLPRQHFPPPLLSLHIQDVSFTKHEPLRPVRPLVAQTHLPFLQAADETQTNVKRKYLSHLEGLNGCSVVLTSALSGAQKAVLSPAATPGRFVISAVEGGLYTQNLPCWETPPAKLLLRLRTTAAVALLDKRGVATVSLGVS